RPEKRHLGSMAGKDTLSFFGSASRRTNRRASTELAASALAKPMKTIAFRPCGAATTANPNRAMRPERASWRDAGMGARYGRLAVARVLRSRTLAIPKQA